MAVVDTVGVVDRVVASWSLMDTVVVKRKVEGGGGKRALEEEREQKVSRSSAR